MEVLMRLYGSGSAKKARIAEDARRGVPFISLNLGDEPARESKLCDGQPALALPGDALVSIFGYVLLKDKQAPRLAAVETEWTAAMKAALLGFRGRDHLWWSQPHPPIRPLITEAWQASRSIQEIM